MHWQRPKYDATLVDIFLTLQIFGAVAFAFIILSASIFRGVKRQPIWFSFCIAWFIYCVSYSFLVLIGQHRKHPAHNTCVAQAALIYAAPLLAGGTSLGLVLHLLLSIVAALSYSPNHEQKSFPITTTFLIWLPWMIWIGVIVAVLVQATTHSSHVLMSVNRTYCVIKDTRLSKVVAVSVITICIAFLGAEVLIGILLYRNRAIAGVLGLSMALRIFIFTLIVFSALLCGLIFTVTHARGVQFDVIISTLPPAAAISFGTQMDLLKGWMFWTWTWTWTWTRQPTPSSTGVPSITEPQESIPTAIRTPSKVPVCKVPNYTSSSSRAALQPSFLYI